MLLQSFQYIFSNWECLQFPWQAVAQEAGITFSIMHPQTLILPQKKVNNCQIHPKAGVPKLCPAG